VRAIIVFDSFVVGLWLCDVLFKNIFMNDLVFRLVFWDKDCELIGITLIS